jgi:hypothetical protein
VVHYQGRFHPGLGTDHQLLTGLEFLATLVPHIQLRFEAKIHLYGALSTTLRKRWGWIGQRPEVSLASISAEPVATPAKTGLSAGAASRPSESAAAPDTGAGAEAGLGCVTKNDAMPASSQPPAVASGSQEKGCVRLVEREPETDFVRMRRRTWAQLIRRVWLVDPELCHRCGGTMKVIAAYASPAQDSVIRAILEARKEWDPPWLRARASPAIASSATRSTRDDDSSRIEYDVMPEIFPDCVDAEPPSGDD